MKIFIDVPEMVAKKLHSGDRISVSCQMPNFEFSGALSRVRRDELLAAIRLFPFVLDWHCIQWRFKGNEENARVSACTQAVVGSFRRAVCISPWLEDGHLLSVVGDMKFACNQYHALR
jgi:hypothetical protein